MKWYIRELLSDRTVGRGREDTIGGVVESWGRGLKV